MNTDRNFDDLIDQYLKKICHNKKGILRNHIILRDLHDHCKLLTENKSLFILDSGCGNGKISLELSKKGHTIICNDISINMIELCKNEFLKENPHAQVEFSHKPIQKFIKDNKNLKFDIILFHAVLEWLEKPEETLQKLLTLLSTDGYISLMFYNIHSLIMRNLIYGNHNKVIKQDFMGDESSLTPQNPLYPENVKSWLNKNNIEIIHSSGVRVFYDFMDQNLQRDRNIEDILHLEDTYSNKEPYKNFGRYIHYLCKNNNIKRSTK